MSVRISKSFRSTIASLGSECRYEITPSLEANVQLKDSKRPRAQTSKGTIGVEELVGDLVEGFLRLEALLVGDLVEGFLRLEALLVGDLVEGFLRLEAFLVGDLVEGFLRLEALVEADCDLLSKRRPLAGISGIATTGIAASVESAPE